MTYTVMHYTDSTGFGGSEQVLLFLMVELKKRGWQPMLVFHASTGIQPLVDAVAQQGMAAWAVPRMRDGQEGASRVWNFSRQLRERQPAIFHAHLTWPLACKFGLVGALLARVPAIVATVHLYLDFPVNPSVLIQQRLLAAWVGRYIAVSQHLADQLCHKLRWPTGTVQVIRNCVPTSFQQDITHLNIKLPFDHAGRPTFLTVARLDEQKGHRYLLEAAAHIPEADFMFVGDGPLHEMLEAQAHRLGIQQRVKFLGYRSDIAHLLATCDGFILPSLYEGLPLSVLEAMAAGRPVIATQIGGTDEAVIDGQTGLLVAPANSIALAHAIRVLLQDKTLAQRLGAAGRMRAQQEFSTERVIQQTADLYGQLLAKRKGRA